jgi:hypothetical protein
VNLSEVLTNVSDFSSSIGFDAKIFDSVGIKRDDKIGQSVTFQTEVDPGFWTNGLGGADAVPF